MTPHPHLFAQACTVAAILLACAVGAGNSRDNRSHGQEELFTVFGVAAGFFGFLAILGEAAP